MTVCDDLRQIDNATGRDVIAQRARPQILLLDFEYRVALAEWDTGFEIFRKLGLETRYATHLLPELESAVRIIVDALRRNPLADSSITFNESLVIRVNLLGGDTHYVALYVEPSRRREDLTSAAKRFRLTQRQIEVLGFVLRGASAKQIAETLCISETTVGDYFKQLISRTNARNRADMVARVLNWNDGGDRRRNPSK
ncbi:MAG: hypothetical protein JO322_14235 [Candidatus Eremiobacteraeota bacterium]|nr:hypothetical protein [Candidatus Eremiobacteraeota bacterium]